VQSNTVKVVAHYILHTRTTVACYFCTPWRLGPFVWLCDLRRPTYTDCLRRPVFCRCWPTSMELFANRTKTIWQSRTVYTAIKDPLGWVMGPQRLVTFCN